MDGRCHTSLAQLPKREIKVVSLRRCIEVGHHEPGAPIPEQAGSLRSIVPDPKGLLREGEGCPVKRPVVAVSASPRRAHQPHIAELAV
jgi:hypothetical protein